MTMDGVSYLVFIFHQSIHASGLYRLGRRNKRHVIVSRISRNILITFLFIILSMQSKLVLYSDEKSEKTNLEFYVIEYDE